MAQNFVAATVLNIDDIKNQLRKASSSINVFRSNRDVIPVKLRATKGVSQNIGDHFVLDHPTNGVLDSSVLELDTGLGSSSTSFVKWNNSIVKEFLYVNDFIDSTNTTASVGSDSVVFSDGQLLRSEYLTVGLGDVSSATFLSPSNLSGTGSLSYYLSVQDSGAVESVWYPISEGVSSALSDASVTGTNTATFMYSGNSAIDGLIGYYPFINGSAVDETANSNDGTLSTATVIDDCEATTGWSNSTLNTDVNVYGTNSLSLNGGFTDWGVTDKTIGSTNLSSKIVTLHIYFASQTVIDNLRATIPIEFSYGSDSSNRYKFKVEKTNMVVGWNIFRVDIENPNDGTVGTPPATSAITWIRFAINTDVAFSTGDIAYDYIQFGAPVKSTDHLGNDNGALRFSGQTGSPSRVDLGANTLDLSDGELATFGMWYKYRGHGADSNNYAMSSGGQWALFVDYNGSDWGWYVEKADGNTRYSSSGSSHDDGEWHRLIVTLDASRNVKLYEDGVLVGSSTYTSAVFNSSTRNSFIGTWTDSYGGVDADITEVFFHRNHAWSANEVLDDYTNGLIHKWNDPIDTSDNNAIRINGLTQYKTASEIVLSRTASALSWTMNVTQHMLDKGFVIFGRSWKNGQSHVVLKFQGGSYFIYYESNSNGNGAVWTTPSGFVTGEHHFVMSWENSLCTLYVDGVSQGVGSTLGTGIVDDLYLNLIGNQAFGYNYGDIAWTKFKDIRFFPNNSLTQDDVTWLYNGGSAQTLTTNPKWESVTLNQEHTFTYTGSNLQYKIESSGDKTISIKNDDGSNKPIELSYNL